MNTRTIKWTLRVPAMLAVWHGVWMTVIFHSENTRIGLIAELPIVPIMALNSRLGLPHAPEGVLVAGLLIWTALGVAVGRSLDGLYRGRATRNIESPPADAAGCSP